MVINYYLGRVCQQANDSMLLLKTQVFDVLPCSYCILHANKKEDQAEICSLVYFPVFPKNEHLEHICFFRIVIGSGYLQGVSEERAKFNAVR